MSISLAPKEVTSGPLSVIQRMVSGFKTRIVFERYNIVNDTDLKLAAQKQEAYLQAQDEHNMGTIANIQEISKKEGVNQ